MNIFQKVVCKLQKILWLFSITNLKKRVSVYLKKLVIKYRVRFNKLPLTREKKLSYQIVIYHGGIEQYEEVVYNAIDINTFIDEVLKRKAKKSFRADFACTILLRVELNSYIVANIRYSDEFDDNELKEKILECENAVKKSYSFIIYRIIKTPKPGPLGHTRDEVVMTTKNRKDALKKIIEYFNQNKELESNNQEVLKIFMEILASPYDRRCLYLHLIKEEKEIPVKIKEIEKMVIDKFKSEM